MAVRLPFNEKRGADFQEFVESAQNRTRYRSFLYIPFFNPPVSPYRELI